MCPSRNLARVFEKVDDDRGFSLEMPDLNDNANSVEIALRIIIDEVVELQQKYDKILPLEQLIKTNLSFILKRIDHILGGNSIMGLLKVPLNQSIALDDEVFTDPYSKKTCIYLFSENSEKLAREMAINRSSNSSLTPPNTAHSQIFRDVLTTGKALYVDKFSEMPCRFSETHPQMSSLYLTPVYYEGLPVALFGIANADLNPQKRKAIENVLPSIWRRAIIHAAQIHNMQLLLRQDHYITKLYPKFVSDWLREKNFSTDELIINYDKVAVFFCDIKDFTQNSKDLAPPQLTQELSAYFRLAEEIAACYGIELVKTVGDCIIAVGNLAHTKSDGNPAAIINFANEFIKQIKDNTLSINSIPITIRVGIDYGPITFGLVGFKERKTLDLFGQTVNRASRHESSGEPGKVHISSALAAQLTQGDCSSLIPRRVKLKGFGVVDSYFAPEHIVYQSAPSPVDCSFLPRLAVECSEQGKSLSRLGMFKREEVNSSTRQLPAIGGKMRVMGHVSLSRAQGQLRDIKEHELICVGKSIRGSSFFNKKRELIALRPRAATSLELEREEARELKSTNSI